uniref:Uncharacterized protein n=1 Tax=Pectinophora gossypiella TaxID=13191 RepID=A0A1E1WVJ5_PECGO
MGDSDQDKADNLSASEGSRNEMSRSRPLSAGSGASKRRRSSSSNSESSSSDSSGGEVKRRRRGESDIDFHDLVNKVNLLTSVLLQTPSLQSSVNVPCSKTLPAPNATRELALGPNPDFCLQRPIVADNTTVVEPRHLSLSHISTALKAPLVPPADPVHLRRLEVLQKFGDPAWKDFRYTESLTAHNA